MNARIVKAAEKQALHCNTEFFQDDGSDGLHLTVSADKPMALFLSEASQC